MVSRSRGQRTIVLLVALTAVGGCALLDAFSGVSIGSKCHTDKDCVPGSCLGGSDGGSAWPGGYCTAACEVDGGGCGPGAACASSGDGGTCLATCTWDGGESSCRTNYVCDRHRTGTAAACVPACRNAAGCGTEALACENGFCCGGPGEKCCDTLGPCRSGYACGSDDYCGAPNAGNADGGVPTGDGGTACPPATPDLCSGQCVDLEADPSNCGACGTKCAGSQACTNGSCGTCTASQTSCGGTCVDLSSDANNCGACGRSCLGGACRNGMCPVKVLASGLTDPREIATDGTSLFWIEDDGGKVDKGPIAGGAVTNLVSGVSYPDGITVGGSSVYWVGWGTCGAYRIPIGGGAGATLTTDCQPRNIVTVGGYVYFAITHTGVIYRSAVDSNSITPIVSGETDPGLVASDGSWVYWVSFTQGTLRRAPAVGGGPATTLASGLNHPCWAAVDDTYVYWKSQWAGTIKRMPKAGGTPTTIASGQSFEPQQMGLYASPVVSDGKYIYWSSAFSGQLLRSERDGTDPIVLYDTGQPWGLVLHGNYIYFTDHENGTILRTAR